MTRAVRRSSAQLRAELEFVEALEPIEQAHLDAKQAYQEAVASGDQAAIRAAKARKLETGNRLNDTREWLRREAEIIKLQTVSIPRLERVAAGCDDPEERTKVEQAILMARRELDRLTGQAEQVRAALEALGGHVAGSPAPQVLPPGSADVTTSSITVKPRVNRAGKDI